MQPEASAVSSSQLYTFASDEAEFSIPHELLAEMANWHASDTAVRVWQRSIWCRITSGGSSLWRAARFTACDGCRMLRADFPTSLPEGEYRVCSSLTELIPARDEWPREIDYAQLWDAFPPKGPWSIDPAYFAAISRVEKALTKAHLRECPPKGSPKEKSRQRLVANTMFLSSFELGGSMDAMRVRFGSTDIRALIMPRAL